MTTTDSVFRAYGMLWPTTGWESDWTDCTGSVYFSDKAEAQKFIDEGGFLKGGYGIDGWFDAPTPAITEVSKDSVSDTIYDSWEDAMNDNV